MSTTSSGPSRRTLVKGAAWSVPVVAMAQPAMAATCSQDPSQAICNCLAVATASGCKYPGNNPDPRFDKSFRAKVCFTANSCDPSGDGIAEIQFTGVDVGGSGCPREIVVTPQAFTVAEDETFCVFVFFRADSSGNRDLTFYYSLNGQPGYQVLVSKVFTGGQADCEEGNCGGPGQDPCPPYTEPASDC